LAIASGDDVRLAREMVVELVKALVRRGANFVVPVDAEPKRQADGLPICFDWLVWLKLTRFGGAPHTFAGGFSHGQNPSAVLA
jgi:hypothetical protein